MKYLTICIIFILSIYSCKKDEGIKIYKFWTADTALIPYTGHNTLKFVRLEMHDSSVYDTITLIGQGREYYMHPSDDLGPSTSNEVYDGEAFRIHFDAYTAYRRSEFDVTIAYRTVDQGTQISVGYGSHGTYGEFAGNIYEWNCDNARDMIINGILYKDVTKYGPDACYIYNTSYAHRPDLTFYYNHDYGLLRLIDEDLKMVWELLP